MLSLADKTWIRLKSVFLRITLTRFTAAFFLFSFLHCFAQGIIQSFLYSIDDAAASVTTDILRQADAPFDNWFAWLTRPEHGAYRLQACDHIPRNGSDPLACHLIFDSRLPEVNHTVPWQPSGPFAKRASENLTIVADRNNTAKTIDGVILVVHQDNGTHNTTLSLQCTGVMLYPDQVLKNSRREELALIGSQFWIFVISFYAILYDSIPHLYAALFTRVLHSGWSAYSIWRTQDIHRRFEHLLFGPETACHVQEQVLFPTYFSQRMAWQIPDLVLNVVALVISIYLVWRLSRTYREHVFQRVGPPKAIVKIYRIFLATFVCLQVSSFFLVTLMGLWIDQLVNSAIAHVSTHTKLYDALLIVTCICLIPWIVMGWYAVRREMKKTMVVFIAVALVLIGGWSSMFDSMVFRWTFVQWPFLGCMTVASFIFLVASLALGILCWFKFGKGLRHYLHVENVLAQADFEPERFETDLEKAKSSLERPASRALNVQLPTFAAFSE